MKKLTLTLCIFFLSLLVLVGCTEMPPENKTDVCAIFKTYPHWYWAAQKAQRRWGVPISTIMAFIYQESRYYAKARPPRDHLLWVIPWFRPSTSYGYAQALDTTWGYYKTEAGRAWASRSSFADTTDFIGWYIWKAHQKAGISRKNAYADYLAYHEGIGGYMRGTHRHKTWLKRVAHKVQNRADLYHYQLIRCKNSLSEKPWWHIW